MTPSYPRRALSEDRRSYRKDRVEIASIEFVPMSEVDRQRVIAVLADLFLASVDKTAPEPRSSRSG